MKEYSIVMLVTL